MDSKLRLGSYGIIVMNITGVGAIYICSPCSIVSLASWGGNATLFWMIAGYPQKLSRLTSGQTVHAEFDYKV